MKRLLMLLVLILLTLSSCAPATVLPARTNAPLSLKDGLGRSVSLASPAQKIVSMAPSNTEILFAVGAGSQVIGRDEFSDFPAEAKKLPSVGGSMGKYNFEQIAKLQPDLVLASDLNTPEQVKALEDLKLTVYVLGNPTTLETMYGNLEIVGALAGRRDEASKLVASLKERQKKVTDTLASAKGTPKIFYEIDATDPSKPYTAGANTFIDILIKLAGGENVGAKLKGDYPQISQEELLVQNPAIILLGDGAYGVTLEQVSQRAGWSGLSAVKEMKIYTFDDNLVSRPGPRLVDGLETLAKIIHPEVFK